MAMKSLSGRLLQHVSRNPLFRSHFPNNEASCRPLSIFGRYTKLIRRIQTESESCMLRGEVAKKSEVCDSNPASSNIKPLSDLKAQAIKANSEFSVTSSATSKLKVSSRHDLAMVFTCKVCETRSVKTCCRESYENGVVVVRCGGCNNLHLMADRLGWFGEPGSVEDLLASRGDNVKRDSVDSFNFTLEDLAGKKP